METKYLTKAEINEASFLLGHGELVAFPTETVYGLGALASNEHAVKKVYVAKGRPSDNPLIVHLATLEDLWQYVKDTPDYLEDLLTKFWPGPLTVVLNLKANIFSKSVTGGLTTCAFRIPDNKVARELIAQTGPLVAPSANTSGRPSPTNAKHVIDDLNGKIAAVLDDGSCQVGVESTVIDATDEEKVVILRPGKIGIGELEKELEIPVEYDKHLLGKNEVPKAPGMKYKHYAPQTKVLMLKSIDDLPEAIITFANHRVGLLASDEVLKEYKDNLTSCYSLGEKKDSKLAAHNLFAGLRALDEDKLDLILVETYDEDSGLGNAYMNRLSKAANNDFFEK